MSMLALSNYDHVHADVDESKYFPYICDLIERSRDFLADRTSKEIYEVSIFIDFAISLQRKYFDHEVALFCENAEEAEHEETSGNFSDLMMLKEFFYERVPGDIAPFYVVPESVHHGQEISWHESELFAVLSLMSISAAMRFYDTTEAEWFDVFVEHKDIIKGRIPNSTDGEMLKGFQNTVMKDAVGRAIVAAQCIEHAQRLLEDFNKEVAKRDKQSEIAGALNAAKHQETYRAKNRVLEEWEKDKSRFASASKAGRYFSDWLKVEGLKEHEPSTITNWIRVHARKTGTKLR